MPKVVTTLLDAAVQLRDALLQIEYPESITVYHPLDYAWEAYKCYVEKFARGSCRVVFLGMNPGPFGMAQTGVPFGEVAAVRDWMEIQSPVGKPRSEHPKRPVLGFDCPRSEVSGRRLWGLFAQRFESAESFFSEHFVLNYCPLLFLSETGANLTPDKLPVELRQNIEAHCAHHLARVLGALAPQWAVGVGGYAENQIVVISGEHPSWQIARILHPSPASPVANRDWAGTATRQLIAAGIWAQ